MANRALYILVAVAGLTAAGWTGWRMQRGADVLPDWARSTRGDAPREAARGAPAGRGADGKGAGGPSAGVAPGGPAGARGPIGVEATAATRMAMTDEISATGSLRANESTVLRPEVAGRILTLSFGDGQRVQKGALLVTLDASVPAAEAEQARAELALVRANYERQRELAERNFVSKAALDQAASNMKVAEAKLQLAEARLDRMRVRAPFSGVIGLRNLSVGDYVKEGADLVVLEDVSSMKVDLRLPERYLGQVGRGQSLELAIDALPGRTFRATVDALDVQVDANGRSILARARVPNPDGVLRSGMFARARVVLRDRPQAIVVPEEAIVPQGEQQSVWKVADGRALKVPVRTGTRRAGKVEVTEGVAPGDLVVTAGQIKLQRDGTEVRVVEAGGGQGAAPAAGAPVDPAGRQAPGAAARPGA